MRVKTVVWIGVICWLFSAALPAARADDGLIPLLSETAILMDADSGQILVEKDMHRPMAPASITKIMTALLALEHGDPDDRLTVSQTAAGPLIDGAANIALRAGETLSLRDLLYALMLPSANDAALVIAEHIGGSLESFVAMMNEKAASFGALNTQFLNPHGLTEPGHQTSAYDMACILRAALADPVFMEIASAQSYTIEPTNLTPEPRNLLHTHAMIRPRANADFPFEGILCGKTGFTTPSGHTLATAARRDGRTLVAIVLKSTGTTDKYLDSDLLFEYGFSAFVDVTLPRSEIASLAVTGPDTESDWLASPASEADAVFLLHYSLADTPVEVRYDLPDPLTGLSDGQASVRLVLPESVDSGLMYPVLWSGDAVIAPRPVTPAVPDEDTVLDAPLPAEPDVSLWPDLWIVAILIFLLAALLAAGTLFFADRSKRRRRRRRRSMKK